MSTNRKLFVKATQLKTGNNIANEARPPRRLAYIPGAAVVRHSKSYNLSAALPSRRLLQLCYWKIYSDGPQLASVISPSPLLKNIPNAHPVGPFAQYLGDVLCVVYSQVRCGFCDKFKTGNHQAENSCILDEKKRKKSSDM